MQVLPEWILAVVLYTACSLIQQRFAKSRLAPNPA
jgi:hypothetical protein